MVLGSANISWILKDNRGSASGVHSTGKHCDYNALILSCMESLGYKNDTAIMGQNVLILSSQYPKP